MVAPELGQISVAVGRSQALRLLDKDWCSPEEAAYLLGVGSAAICQAAFGKHLTAEIVGHDVVRVRRDDLLRWMAGSDDRPSGPSAIEQPSFLPAHGRHSSMTRYDLAAVCCRAVTP